MSLDASSLLYLTGANCVLHQTPQMPLAQNVAWNKYQMNEFPTGTNAIVAVLAYTG